MDQLRRRPVVAVDLNVGHLAVAALDCYGNPQGVPATIPLVLEGRDATTRDARIRGAVSQTLAIAAVHHAGAVVIENLDFVEQRFEGREHAGNRPSRGKRGKAFRRHISGLPTATLRDRLAQMSYNARVGVITVDPAYTSKWGAQHWLAPLKAQHPKTSLTSHHAASVAIGRRGLGQRIRRRGMSARTSPVDGERATASASKGWPMPRAELAGGLDELTTDRDPEPRTGARQSSEERRRRPQEGGRKTVVPTRSKGDQGAQDRSRPPAEQESVSLGVQERCMIR